MARPVGLEEVPLLEALRVDRGLTVRDVARLTGVAHKTIMRYEAAEQTRPHGDALERLARLYNVRASTLLEDIRKTARKRERFDAAA